MKEGQPIQEDQAQRELRLFGVRRNPEWQANAGRDHRMPQQFEDFPPTTEEAHLMKAVEEHIIFEQ
jgi:predicted AAA+ superfamily ATPase